MNAEPLLSQGLGREPAAPEWPPLTAEETSGVLERFGITTAQIVWRSPRPWSAAALVLTDCGTVFVKRHHRLVRSGSDLTAEHGFSEHLRSGGIPMPRVLAMPGGGTALPLDHWVYEVHAPATGEDLYRDALSWTPYQVQPHAAAAGAALARLHLVAASYAAPARPGPPLLCSSARVISAPDLPAALDQWLAVRPATARHLADRGGRTGILTALEERLAPVAEVWPSLPSSWAHHDWHGSNVLWTAGEVAGIIDLGLADRTGPAFDVATALERSMISWLDLTDDPPAMPRVRLDQMGAFLQGYQHVRPLSDVERAAIPLLLPVVHVELALSEVEYYLAVRGDRSSAALAYEGYLLGHLAFFAGLAGQDALASLGRLLDDHQ